LIPGTNTFKTREGITPEKTFGRRRCETTTDGENCNASLNLLGIFFINFIIILCFQVNAYGQEEVGKRNDDCHFCRHLCDTAYWQVYQNGSKRLPPYVKCMRLARQVLMSGISSESFSRSMNCR
jgi:hypothetical protein